MPHLERRLHALAFAAKRRRRTENGEKPSKLHEARELPSEMMINQTGSAVVGDTDIDSSSIRQYAAGALIKLSPQTPSHKLFVISRPCIRKATLVVLLVVVVVASAVTANVVISGSA